MACALPCVETQLHLDTSLPVEFVVARAAARGVEVPALGRLLPALVLSMVREEGLASARAWLCQFLQTADEVREATAAVACAAAASGVVLLELHICPQAHTREGLSAGDVVAAAVAGFAAASNLAGGLVLSVRAGQEEQAGHESVLLAAQWARRGVLAVELAAQEAPQLRALASWRAVAHSAASAEVALSLHASDVDDDADSALANVSFALKHGAARLSGCGALLSAPAVLAAVARAGLPCELCVTAAVLPGAPGAPRCFAEHPVGALLAAGLTCVPCVGHALLCDSSVAGGAGAQAVGLARLVAHCGLSWTQVRALMLVAAGAAFHAPERRQPFVAAYSLQLEEALQRADAFAPPSTAHADAGAAESAGCIQSAAEAAENAVWRPAQDPARLGGALMPRGSHFKAAQRAASPQPQQPAAAAQAAAAPRARSSPAPFSGEEPASYAGTAPSMSPHAAPPPPRLEPLEEALSRFGLGQLPGNAGVTAAQGEGFDALAHAAAAAAVAAAASALLAASQSAGPQSDAAPAVEQPALEALELCSPPPPSHAAAPAPIAPSVVAAAGAAVARALAASELLRVGGGPQALLQPQAHSPRLDPSDTRFVAPRHAPAADVRGQEEAEGPGAVVREAEEEVDDDARAWAARRSTGARSYAVSREEAGVEGGGGF